MLTGGPTFKPLNGNSIRLAPTAYSGMLPKYYIHGDMSAFTTDSDMPTETHAFLSKGSMWNSGASDNSEGENDFVMRRTRDLVDWASHYVRQNNVPILSAMFRDRDFRNQTQNFVLTAQRGMTTNDLSYQRSSEYTNHVTGDSERAGGNNMNKMSLNEADSSHQETAYTLDNATEKTRLENQAKALYGGYHYFFPFLRDGMTVLDVGSGVGTISRAVATKFPSIKVTGIDANEERVFEARRLATEEGLDSQITFMKADAYALPFPNDHFDVTHARFVFMHLVDPKMVLKEMIRVTKPGGTIVIHEGFHDAIWITPNRPSFEHILSEWKSFMREKGQDPSIGIRLHTMLSKEGLKEVTSEVLTNTCSGHEPAFGLYMSNWIQHLPSLKDSMGDRLSDTDITHMQKELSHIEDGDFYLELTVVGSGKKCSDR